MAEQSHKPHLYFELERSFENHHQNVRFNPERYYDLWNLWEDSNSPRTQKWKPGLRAIQQIIREAELRDVPARALGAGWSLSEAAVTGGFLLNTKPLNVIEVGLHKENCDSEFLDRQPQALGTPEDRLVFAQCGATIAELNVALENVGLSLPTSGASNGQTICGAMSTGTHGAAWQFGSVQDFVLGLHLIAEGGQGYWIERASAPVMNQRFCDILDAKLIRDDRLFNAVRVSFGSFGIIHAVVLQVEPIFLLERHVVPYHFDSVLPVLSDLEAMDALRLTDINGDIPPLPPFHFEILLNPYSFTVKNGAIREKDAEMAAYVRYMYKHPPDLSTYSMTGHLLGRAPTNQTISNEAFDLVGMLANLAPLASGIGVLGSGVRGLLEGQLKPDNGLTHHGTVLTHGGTFDSTQIPGHSLSCELGFDRADVPEAVKIIIGEMLAFPIASIPSLRYVKHSDALLAFTPFTPYTCAIEFPTVGTDRSRQAYGRIWKALERAGIRYTYHWGQCLKWGDSPEGARRRLAHVFGDRLSSWIQARRDFLSTKGRRTFSNRMLEECGLAD